MFKKRQGNRRKTKRPSKYPNRPLAGSICPKCPAPMFIRPGPNGYFLACGRYPICSGTRYRVPDHPIYFDWPKSISRISVFEPTTETRKCPTCQYPMVLKFDKKNRPFLGCSMFPLCRSTFKPAANMSTVKLLELMDMEIPDNEFEIVAAELDRRGNVPGWGKNIQEKPQ